MDFSFTPQGVEGADQGGGREGYTPMSFQFDADGVQVPNLTWARWMDRTATSAAKETVTADNAPAFSSVVTLALGSPVSASDSPQQSCTVRNVGEMRAAERYEGHTADVLFTRWLETTSAALTPVSPVEGLSGGVDGIASTPPPIPASIMALQGHPLSMQRVVNAACAHLSPRASSLGTGWQAASPLPNQPAFARWQDEDEDAAEDSENKPDHDCQEFYAVRSDCAYVGVFTEETQSEGMGREPRGILSDLAMSQLADGLSTMNMGQAVDDMVSPIRRMGTGRHKPRTPASPNDQVLALMAANPVLMDLSPLPPTSSSASLAALGIHHNPAGARVAPGALEGEEEGSPGELLIMGGPAQMGSPIVGGMHMGLPMHTPLPGGARFAGAGQTGVAWQLDSSDSDDEVTPDTLAELAHLGFSPLSPMPTSPVCELLAMMMTPVAAGQ